MHTQYLVYSMLLYQPCTACIGFASIVTIKLRIKKNWQCNQNVNCWIFNSWTKSTRMHTHVWHLLNYWFCLNIYHLQQLQPTTWGVFSTRFDPRMVLDFLMYWINVSVEEFSLESTLHRVLSVKIQTENFCSPGSGCQASF